MLDIKNPSMKTKKSLDVFLPFTKPTICDDAINEVVECLKSGWITTGPRVEQFESMIQDYCIHDNGEKPHVISLTSGTAALQLALMSFQLEPGSEVITTPFTFAATLNTIVLAGLTPVVVDVDPHTYNIDVSKIESAITPKTKAIMPVHFAGLSVDMDSIIDIAKRHNLRILEDAAHAIGTTYNGKRIGTFGDTQIFSFHPNKNMTTGEGGCVITNSLDEANYVRRMGFHGIDRPSFNRFSKKGSQHYDVVEAGYKFNMLDMMAALGIHQIKQLDGFIQRRTELANRYFDGLKGCKGLTLPANGDGHAWHLFSPLVNAPFDRDEVIQELKERNVGCGLHWRAITDFTYYQNTFNMNPDRYPIATDIGRRILSLPLFPELTNDLQDQVIDIIWDVLGK
jgi:dTDP-4-amino-4,6-dideoxygalactose transaminase